MGCDGGTIPTRGELVKVKRKPESKDKQAELSFKWQYCTISQEELQLPIVTCHLGRFYNKDSVIHALLNRSLLPETAKHIQSLKDITDLHLIRNPEYNQNAEKSDGMTNSRAAPFICPITGLEMTGKFRFVSLWSCGCVFSERALIEIETQICHNCQKTFTTKDVIVLNGNDADLEEMRINMAERKLLQRMERKLKNANNTNFALKKYLIVSKKRTVSDGLLDPDIKKIKSYFSIAKDPNATDIYKSLFTTSKIQIVNCND